MTKKELTKDVEHAIKWLAAEFKFLKRLHSDLERVEELGEKNKIDEERSQLSKDIRVVRYVGRAERRVEGDVQNVIKELKEARQKTVSHDQIDKLLQEIEVPAAELLREGSIYVGNLKA